MSDLPKRLRIKAGMIQLGEHIAWGSDAEIMAEAADEIERLKLRLWDLEHSEVDHVLRERDTLRKQLDGARELLEQSQISKSGYDWDSWERNVDAWLEATKP